jgi:hypothetical protein
MIFGGLAGYPGYRHECAAIAAVFPDEQTAGLALGGNAARVYDLKLES